MTTSYTNKYTVNNKIHNNILLTDKNKQKKPIAFPSGIIMIWNFPDKIPYGWTLCNGTGKLSNGVPVPDLRGRFIRMMNDNLAIKDNNSNKPNDRTCKINSYATGSIGGSEIIDWDKKYLPNHTHNTTYQLNCVGNNMVDSDHISFDANSVVRGATKYVEYSKNGNQKYNDNNINKNPPYVALTYIIKL